MIKTLIIDDETNSVETLKQMLQQVCTNIELIATARNVTTGIESIRAHHPDLILLDIQMPDGTGFDLLKHFPNPDFAIIFITAYGEYALKALKVSALDYILKPYDPEEIQQACRKAAKAVEQAHLQTKLQAFFENMESLSRDMK